VKHYDPWQDWELLGYVKRAISRCSRRTDMAALIAFFRKLAADLEAEDRGF
jgi:hypothetical protein